MKKKLFLMLAMAFVLCTLLAFSVFAADSVPASGRLGTNTIVEGIALPTVLDTESQIQMDDGLVYPSFYFFKDQTTSAWDFSKVKNEDGSDKYTIDNVIKLEIPHGITYLTNMGYRDQGRTTLTHVRIPNTITGNNWNGGFRSTKSLTSVEFEEGYSYKIFESMFHSCPIENFVIPEGVTSIEKESLCSMGLTTITIPDSVTYIGVNSFTGNPALKEVIISPTSQLKKIDNSAFSGLHGLTEPFYFPSSLETLGTWVFSSSYNVSAFLNLENTQLTVLSEGVFYENYKMTSLTLPSTLQSISIKTFNKCVGLETITISGNSLTSIGVSAFEGCTSLTSINLPSSLTTIGNNAFKSCGKLSSVDLPNGLTTIGSFAFTGAGLVSVVVPETVTSFGTDVFNGCSKLKSATLPSHFTSIPLYTFYRCSSLERFDMSDNVTYIGQYAFYECGSLGPVYLSKNIETIYSNGSSKQGAFQSCGNLYFVNNPGDTEKPDVYFFPESLVSLGGASLKNSANLNSTLVFPAGMQNLDDDGWNFGNRAQTYTRNIVFLGEYTELKFANENTNTNFYFVNPNVTSETLTLTCVQNPSNCYAYVCSDGMYAKLGQSPEWVSDGYAHIANPNSRHETDATCTLPKMVADYCFCGSLVAGSEVTDGDPLGHDTTGECYYVFESLVVAGKSCVDCSRCDYVAETALEKAVVTALGYSVKTFGTKSFTTGYYVDKELLKKYEAVKDINVSFGFAFNALSTFDFNGTLDSFKLVASIHNVGTKDNDFNAFTYQMNYANDDHISDLIVICAYAMENDTLTFLNAPNGEFEAISYELALSLAPLE